ncbi:MAG: class I SAM-dependent methyltransferase [Alphaproteobacteria bacterium]
MPNNTDLAPKADPNFELKRYLGQHIAGKDVLDIGSINHSFGVFRTRDWLFDFLVESTNFVQGVDFEEEQVVLARDAGYEIVYGDAEKYLSDRKYDVVLATELIEHISNPGHFLVNARANMKPDGRLIISTPNAFSFTELYKVVRGWTNNPKTHWQHVCYYTPSTLIGLAARAGFTPLDVAYVNFNYVGGSRFERVMLGINRIACRLGRHFGQGMVIVFKVDD